MRKDRKLGRRMRRGLLFLLLCAFVCGIALKKDDNVRQCVAEVKSVFSELGSRGQKSRTVVIDVGHGGNDPGKIPDSGMLEKDINLAIALQLKKLLGQSDLEVILTRETDAALYDENAKNKKLQDMQKRVELIEKANPFLVISIHQNSYPQASVHGPQCFYYKTSEKSKQAAELFQEQLNTGLCQEKRREAKSNDNYYLLKKTSTPILIIECGFLSNETERELLNTELYREKVAWNIYLGILKYFNVN